MLFVHVLKNFFLLQITKIKLTDIVLIYGAAGENTRQARIN